MTDSSITVIFHTSASAGMAMVAVLSEQVWMALIAAISAAVVALPTIIFALKGTNKKIDDAKLKVEEKAIETEKKIEKVSTQIDGRLTEFVEGVAKAKYAEGVLEGIAQATKAMSEEKVLNALIAATQKSPVPEPTPIPIPAPEPSKSEVGI